ncbi:IclR family transcriptional regulator [Oricola nitratireducens]|uniref:IclR family transcriptional regulator n=1 Tax=Oricola nitratireducens TaxID=2775868 RepID=UPI001AEE61F5|nr:IclR family transcriptional regulator [Oricola nitratireducens]
MNSLERVLALLDVFTEDRLEWTPEQLMTELGYSRPTLYRYLKVLKEAGFLTSMPSGGFTLGPRVVEMDFLMRKSDTLARYAQPHLESFAADYPCAALLVRWYGNKLLVVASECVTPGLENDYPRGRPLPLARGAISRAIMAHLTRRKLLATIETNLPELAAIGLGADVEKVMDGLRKIRRCGYAVAHGEVTPGVTGIAAPIFDGGNSPVATLCVTIAGKHATPEMTEAIGKRVRDVSAELSGKLAEDRRAA